MGALQDKVDRTATSLENTRPESEALESEPDESEDSDSEPEESEQAPTELEVFQAQKRLVTESIRADLDVDDDWIYYTLTEPLEPPRGGGADRFAKLKKLRFPHKLYGRHLSKTVAQGEKTKQYPDGATWINVLMSRIAAYSDTPMEAVERIDQEDIYRLSYVVEDVIAGNLKTSASITKR